MVFVVVFFNRLILFFISVGSTLFYECYAFIKIKFFVFQTLHNQLKSERAEFDRKLREQALKHEVGQDGKTFISQQGNCYAFKFSDIFFANLIYMFRKYIFTLQMRLKLILEFHLKLRLNFMFRIE